MLEEGDIVLLLDKLAKLRKMRLRIGFGANNVSPLNSFPRNTNTNMNTNTNGNIREMQLPDLRNVKNEKYRVKINFSLKFRNTLSKQALLRNICTLKKETSKIQV